MRVLICQLEIGVTYGILIKILIMIPIKRGHDHIASNFIGPATIWFIKEEIDHGTRIYNEDFEAPT
jgi:hypothetical protein